MSTKRTETLKGPGGIVLVLDAREIFPDDPGNGTPALLKLPFGRGYGTFWCAQGTGEVDGVELTRNQAAWLDSIENAVNQWVEIRADSIRALGRDEALAAMS